MILYSDFLIFFLVPYSCSGSFPKYHFKSSCFCLVSFFGSVTAPQNLFFDDLRSFECWSGIWWTSLKWKVESFFNVQIKVAVVVGRIPIILYDQFLLFSHFAFVSITLSKLIGPNWCLGAPWGNEVFIKVYLWKRSLLLTVADAGLLLRQWVSFLYSNFFPSFHTDCNSGTHSSRKWGVLTLTKK